MREAIVEQAATILRTGGVIAIPTETVYGLAADVANDDAVARVYAIKGRPADHPLIVHLPANAELARYAANVTPLLRRLAQTFWPGPLTLVVRKTARISHLVTAGQPTVALRIIDHPLAQAILTAFGGAVAAPSANRFGRISPTTAAHVRDDLGDDVDLVVDGGSARVGVESTIVDLTGDVPAILRAGAISASALAETIGRPIGTRVGGGVRAPGMLSSHYAPRTPLLIVDAADFDAQVKRREARGERVGVLLLPPDANAAAYELYSRLRLLDLAEHDLIIASLPPDIEDNAAVRDRLKRAAAPRQE